MKKSKVLLALLLAVLTQHVSAQGVGSVSSYGCVSGPQYLSTSIFYRSGSCTVGSLSDWSVSGAAAITTLTPGDFSAISVTWATWGSQTISVNCGGTFLSYPGTFTVYPAVTTANAGPSQTGSSTCGADVVQVTGNASTVGDGSWSIESGYQPNSGIGFGALPNTPVNSRTQSTASGVESSYFFGLRGGSYILKYTISDTHCGSSYDTMKVTFNPDAYTTGQRLCGVSSTRLSGKPSSASGVWSIVSGTGGAIDSLTNRNSLFSGIIGNSYTIKWTLTSGLCSGTSSTGTITFYPSAVAPAITVDKNSIEPNELITLSLNQFNAQKRDTVDWGDGSPKQYVGASPISHIYTMAGNFNLSVTSQQIGAPCFATTNKTIGVTNCPELVGIDLLSEQYLCATKFSVPTINDCTSLYTWNFGDGSNPSNKKKRNPFHSYSGTGPYDVSVTIHYNCASLNCAGDTVLTKKVTIPQTTSDLDTLVFQVTSDQRLEVINTTTSSFSDVWPLQYEASALSDKVGYWNGSAGVWRNDAAFAYKEARSQSETVNIQKDGTFPMVQFDWDKAELNAIPTWIRANSITEYSPYGFELENKDALGVYSSAVYDYNGQLPVANGVNMKNKELAYTGFETLEASQGYASGNWLLGLQPPPAYQSFVINTGSTNMAVVEVPRQKLLGYTKADVYTRSLDQNGAPKNNNSTFIQANEIVCSKPHPSTNQWSLVVFDQAPIEPTWMGKMVVKNIIPTQPNPDVDSTIAHTGKRSLRVTGSNRTFSQKILRLDSGKMYRISAWVTVPGAAQVSTPSLGNVGMQIQINRENGTPVGTLIPINASGPIIEGWQQVSGEFVCSINNAVFDITFKRGSSTAWYDDLRLHPKSGNMKSYVYDPRDFRLKAILDEENFASFFYYDAEGNLYLTKKETVDGIKTLTENISYQIER